MGVIIALLIILLWGGHLIFSLLVVEINPGNPLLYLHILIQTFLYTGLFITAHDAMHGAVARNRKLNNFLGNLSTTLYAFLSYKKLSRKHYLHHRFPATDQDPDFSPVSNNFFVWWFNFMKNYITWWQMLLMAVVFNVFLIWFEETRIIVFWVIPPILSTFQLFFFGTYLPHRKPFSEDMNPHNSRSLPENHFIAMFSCYYFGYHWEHHQSPTTPWWKLYQVKKRYRIVQKTE